MLERCGGSLDVDAHHEMTEGEIEKGEEIGAVKEMKNGVGADSSWTGPRWSTISDWHLGLV